MTRFTKFLIAHWALVVVVVLLNIWLQGEIVVRGFNLIVAGYISLMGIWQLKNHYVPAMFHYYQLHKYWDKPLRISFMLTSWAAPPMMMILQDTPSVHNYAFWVYIISFAIVGIIIVETAKFAIQQGLD